MAQQGTVVDALVVSLGLDASGFTAGQKQMVKDLQATETAANRTAKGLQASGKDAAEFFSSIKTEALGLLGVFMGGKGLEAFVKDTTRALSDMGRTAGIIGDDVRSIQAFELAVERMGGSASAAHQSLLGLSKARQEWLAFGTNANQAQFLGLIGASATMSPLEIMKRFTNFAAAHPGEEAKLRQFGEGAGIDFTTITSLLQMGRTSSFEAEMKRSFELGDVASKQQIEAATKFQTAVTSFEQVVEGFSRNMLGKILPGLTSAIDGLVNELVHPPKALTPDELRQKLISDSAHVGGDMNSVGGAIWDYLGLPKYNRSGGGAPGGGSINVPMGPTEAHGAMLRTKEFFKSKGLTDAQIAGIMAGGPAAESGFNSRSWGDGGTSYGLFQHHAGRLAGMQRQAGTQTPSEQQQLEYTWWELTQGPYKGVLEAIRQHPNDPAAVARIWTRDFESPAGGAAEADRRASNAYKFNVPHVGPTFGPQRAADAALNPNRLIGPRVSAVPAAATISNDLDIHSINIYPPNGDPNIIAGGIRRALGDINAQADRGLE